MNYTITYLDNQLAERKETVQARTFGEAVTKVEDNANEQGHGISSIVSGVRHD